MRKILLFATAALLSPNARAQQTTDDGLACFENLPTPEFPAAALQAHVDGSVWTWTQVNAQGTPDKIDTQVVSAWRDGAKLLTAPVEKTIRAAKIKPECAGKTIRAVFRYQLHGEAIADPKVTSRIDGPTLMWIESQPASRAQVSSGSANP
jgi:hypothetical protein